MPKYDPTELEKIIDEMKEDHSVKVFIFNHHFGHAEVLQGYIKRLIALRES